MATTTDAVVLTEPAVAVVEVGSVEPRTDRLDQALHRIRTQCPTGSRLRLSVMSTLRTL